MRFETDAMTAARMPFFALTYRRGGALTAFPIATPPARIDALAAECLKERFYGRMESGDIGEGEGQRTHR